MSWDRMGSANFKSALANDKDPEVKELHSLTLENTRENQKGFHGATTPRKNERGRGASEVLPASAASCISH